MGREPRQIRVVAGVAAFLLAVTLAAAPVAAQVVTGVQLPFRFTGTIDKLAFNLGPSQLNAADQKAAAEAAAKAKD